MHYSKETERELNILDKAIAKKQDEVLNDLHCAKEHLATQGERIVEQDKMIGVLVNALEGMLDGYKSGNTKLSQVENAYRALAKIGPIPETHD